MSRLRDAAVALNLFYNFQTDFRHFSTLEVAYTYIYLLGFAAAAIVFGLRFFQSTHLSYHCAVAPDLSALCASEFAQCNCAGVPDFQPCRLASTAGCTCCWYGDLELRSGVLYYLSHVGGFYTFSMGASLVGLALVRAVARANAADGAADGAAEGPADAPPQMQMITI